MSWPQKDADHLLVSASQMNSLEHLLLSSGLPVASLMEKVGQSMASWFLQNSSLIENGVVLLIGPGHNGGDGLVVARELYLAGFEVHIWCPFKINKALTAQLLSHVQWLGIRELEEEPAITGKELWIDALFGLGQTKPLPELMAEMLKKRGDICPGRLVSLDVPAGLCSDTGEILQGGVASAAFTLTVGLVKKGLIQDAALPYVGEIVRLDIGLPGFLFSSLPANQPLRIMPADIETFSWPQPDPSSMKYERGRLLVLSGSNNFRGAAWLSLKGALASGVGSIKAGLPKQVADQLWQVAPEIVLAGVLENSQNGDLVIGDFLENYALERIDSLLIGPGIGNEDEPWSKFEDQLLNFSGLLVLDADGINRLALFSEGWKWLQKRNGPTWITPHLIEFRRLFPNLRDLDPLSAVLEAAKTTGAGVLLKGSHSLIADPSGSVWQLSQTAPWVARTGLGDVLAGYVAGIGALGLVKNSVLNADLLAASALLHAEAGRMCRKGSTAGSIAVTLAAMTTKLNSGECLDGYIEM